MPPFRFSIQLIVLIGTDGDRRCFNIKIKLTKYLCYIIQSGTRPYRYQSDEVFLFISIFGTPKYLPYLSAPDYPIWLSESTKRHRACATSCSSTCTPCSAGKLKLPGVRQGTERRKCQMETLCSSLKKKCRFRLTRNGRIMKRG